MRAARMGRRCTAQRPFVHLTYLTACAQGGARGGPWGRGGPRGGLHAPTLNMHVRACAGKRAGGGTPHLRQARLQVVAARVPTHAHTHHFEGKLRAEEDFHAVGVLLRQARRGHAGLRHVCTCSCPSMQLRGEGAGCK